MTAPADTEWEPWGQGSRRIYCGVVCLTISVSGDGRRVPEVRTRQRGQGMVAAHGDTMTEADARAWCERWADVIAREYDALGRAMVAAAQADEREACAKVCDEAATWRVSPDAQAMARELAREIRGGYRG